MITKINMKFSMYLLESLNKLKINFDKNMIIINTKQILIIKFCDFILGNPLYFKIFCNEYHVGNIDKLILSNKF